MFLLIIAVLFFIVGLKNLSRYKKAKEEGDEKKSKLFLASTVMMFAAAAVDVIAVIYIMAKLLY